MIEINYNLFIFSERDFELPAKDKKDWWIVNFCKEPYSRTLWGYRGRRAPKDHPEYLYAVRENRFVLNLIDADDTNYIPKLIIDRGLKFIEKGLQDGNMVLIHCNKGESRYSGISMLYLVANTDVLLQNSSEQVELKFKKKFPSYNANKGIRKFIFFYFYNDIVSNKND
jgi:hypothetical protein